MSKNISIIFIFLFSLCFSSVGSFNYGANAKEVALGGSMVALQNRAFNSFSNPSFLASIKKTEWGISYFTMSLDRSIQVISFSQPVEPAAGVSLSFLRVGVDDIRLSDKDNNQLGIYNHWEGYGMMSFALQQNKASFGINFKLFLNQLKKSDLSDYPARGLGIDLGANYVFNERLTLGFVSYNLMANYKWGEKSNKIKEEIPLITELGILFDYSDRVNIAMQLDFDKNGFDRYRIGTEFLVNEDLTSPITLRFGMKESNNNEVTLLWYLGLGMSFKMNNQKIIHMDYAIDPGNMKEGISHIFSFSI